MSAPLIDLSKRAWQHVRGELTLIGTWIRLDGRHRPCMVMIRTGEEASEHTFPCVVTMDKAWIWSEEIGDPRQAARTVHRFLQALRLNENNAHDHVRVISFIIDYLGDLLHIPPYAPETAALADLAVTERETGHIREMEIRGDV